MSEQSKKGCYSAEELVDYFSPDASPDEQYAVERHLAGCERCLQLGRQVYSATLLLDRWSNEARRIVYPTLVALIEKTSDSTLKQRLRNWIEAWSGRADGAVRMVIESSNRAAQIITEGMEDFLRLGARWQFTLEPASERISVRGPSKGVPISVAIAPGSPQATVAVMSDIGQVEVTIDNMSADKKPPLVILASAHGEVEPQVKEISIARASYGVATFEGVTAGEYLVVLEPTD